MGKVRHQPTRFLNVLQYQRVIKQVVCTIIYTFITSIPKLEPCPSSLSASLSIVITTVTYLVSALISIGQCYFNSPRVW